MLNTFSSACRIGFVLSLLICFYSKTVFPQEVIPQEKIDELVNIYNTIGETGIKDYLKKHKDILNNKTITDIAAQGYSKGKEDLLNIALIMANVYKDEKTIADVNRWYAERKYIVGDDPTEYLEKAKSIYSKLNDNSGLGNVYKVQGDVYYMSGENEKSLETYSESLTYFIKAGDSKGQGQVYLKQGKVHFYMGDNERALELYSKALGNFEKINDIVNIGNIYFLQGNIYVSIGENQQALEMYSKALVNFEKADSPLGQGNVYTYIGQIYSNSGENQKALEMYSKALPFYEEVDNTIGLGNIYSFQGDVYLNTGKYQKALEMYSKALPFFEKMDDPLGQGDILVLQGIVYSLTGNNQKALEMYSKALLLFEKADDPRKQGFVYLSQGNIYSSEGDNNRSLEIFSKALPLLEQADDVVNLGNLYKSQGEVYYYLNDNQRSLEMYSKAISFYEKGEEPLGQGDVYKRQADIFARTGENQKAIDMYSKALTFYEKANAIENEAFLLLSKAELFEKTKQLKDAYDNYVGGLAKLEKVRTQIGFSEMKLGFQEKIGEQYSQAINFMLVNNYDEKAFEYYENTKARTLLDQITEKKMYDVEKGIDSTLKMRRDEISSQLSFCQSQLTQTTDSAAIEELKTQYKSLDDEFEKVKQDIRFKNPLYAAINYPQAVAISKLRSEILSPEEALLQYYFSEDSVFVFVITNDNFEIVKLPASRTEIEQEAANFNERVLSSKKDPYVVSALYQEIIEPLKNYIEDKKTLIIVPDGLLSFIPFEAIYAEGGEEIRYLLEDYNIKYIQSGTMLSLLRKEFEKENTNNSFIGFGDPVYDYENYLAQQPEKGQIVKEEEFALLNRDGYERSGGKLDRLEGSGQEVDEISKMFGTKPYLRLAANEEMVKSAEMKNYGYILFSCHGLISDEFQSLVLSQIPESKEDGYLTLGEITNLDWNAKLVVLSACQTGKGKVKKGEGVVGMTRAIMLAGTPAAVVSLWNVSDQGTKELMVSFFRNINEEEMTKEEALRKAKLEMLKTDYKNPYYWSAFVMYGE